MTLLISSHRKAEGFLEASLAFIILLTAPLTVQAPTQDRELDEMRGTGDAFVRLGRMVTARVRMVLKQ
ncbi:MAG: hypothetical protein JSV00_00720 [bacterium]|nr:MAG: hypothetical protein JSV00_00720 [bacterium]